jgi:nitrate reductase gamma subunit
VNFAALTYWDLDTTLITKWIFNLSFNLSCSRKDFIYMYTVLPYVASNVIFLYVTWRYTWHLISTMPVNKPKSVCQLLKQRVTRTIFTWTKDSLPVLPRICLYRESVQLGARLWSDLPFFRWWIRKKKKIFHIEVCRVIQHLQMLALVTSYELL